MPHNLKIGIIIPGMLVWCVKLADRKNHPVISFIHLLLYNHFWRRLIRNSADKVDIPPGDGYESQN